MHVIRIIFKFLLAIVIFIILSIIAAAFMGGTSPMHKDAVEGALSQLTGQRVTIGKLESLTFFPLIALKAHNVDLHRTNGDSVLIVKHMAFAMDFFDLWRKIGTLRTLEIQGVEAIEGGYTPRPFKIDTLTLNAVTHVLESKGYYGSYPFTFKADVQVAGQKGLERYSLQGPVPISITWGEVQAHMKIEITQKSDFILHDMKVVLGDQSLATADHITLEHKRAKNLRTTGTINVGQSIIERTINLNWENAVPKITGQIHAPVLYATDVIKFVQGISVIHDMWIGSPTTPLEEGSTEEGGGERTNFAVLSTVEADVAITLDTAHIIRDGLVVKAAKAQAILKDGMLKVPFTATLFGYATQGLLTLDENGALIIVADMTGDKTQGKFSLKGSGNTTQAFIQSLTGDMSLYMGTHTIDLPSFLQLIFPSQTILTIDCAMAKGDIKHGVVRSQALKMEAEGISVTGMGTYDIMRDAIDLMIYTSQNFVPCVHVHGSWAQPVMKFIKTHFFPLRSRGCTFIAPPPVLSLQQQK